MPDDPKRLTGQPAPYSGRSMVLRRFRAIQAANRFLSLYHAFDEQRAIEPEKGRARCLEL